MEGFLNIQDRDDIFRKLGNLKSNAVASFGRMSAQHMVEHLVFVLQISNGKLPHKLYFSDEKAAKIKAYTIQTNKEIVVGFRAPMLPEEPVPLKFSGLHEAIEQLKTELTDFDNFFRDNPEARPTNPTMGPLDFEEWIIFHNKHFTHHFRQFQLS
jgi:uncharacterized protein DUF1569